MESELLKITDFLKSRIKPVVIYLYGSALSPYFNGESDIDNQLDDFRNLIKDVLLFLNNTPN